MSEECGDGFQTHAAVDGLGGQGVAQLVGVDVFQTGRGGGLGDGLVDAGRWDGPAAVEQE